MPRHLMAISIGPVQGFIAAARRTRDFWMGSTMLQECAKAVAKAVVELPAAAGQAAGLERLIFPAVDNVGQLQPISFSADKGEVVQAFDVTNVVLFVLDHEADLPDLAQRLKDVAWDRFRMILREAAEFCEGELRDDWEAQLNDDALEFFAAWTVCDEYGAARRRVMRLLAGRKSCRDFQAWDGAAGVPKSSLDGARETVLAEHQETDKDKRRRGLRVKGREQLDLIGVAKRADWGHDAVRYPSVSRVAVDPWVRGVVATAEHDTEIDAWWRQTQAICEALRKHGVLRRRNEKNRRGIEDDLPKFPWLKRFPFEGTPLYVTRHQELRRELREEAVRDDGVTLEQVTADLADLSGTLAKIQSRRVLRRPFEYVAFLAADGDKMGATLSKIGDFSGDALQRHRDFSRLQSEFAKEARGVFHQPPFSGVCFFAAADDVLGMVPVDQALACAEALHALFARKLGANARELGLPAPTLSVGVAVGHFLEPLEDLLSYARAAEDRAKNPSAADEARGQAPRDGLAVAVHPRGGSPFTIRDNWERSTPLPINQRLVEWTRLHRDKALSTKAAYDLRQVAWQYEHAWTDQAAMVGALRADALRVLKRKRRSDQEANEKAQATLRSLIGDPAEAKSPGVKTAEDLIAVAHELIVGQWIADAQRQAEGQPPGAEAVLQTQEAP